MGWLAACLPVHPGDGGMPAPLRAQAGDVLSKLGDPRFDPERFYLPNDDLLGFVRIAADPDFRIGTRKADTARVEKITGYKVPDYEINDAPTPTKEFFIARYPVTVAQFRAFVNARGFGIGDYRALGDPDSRPIRYVSWGEALAYCEWLNNILKTSPDFSCSEISSRIRNGKWQVDLTSELERGKAARGNQPEKIFSWGDNPDPNRANYNESNINDSCAVGCFPANDFGVYDMLGNVWEWTRSLSGFDYPYDPNDRKREDRDAGDDASRVVGGGSWHSSRDRARCAFRNWDPPVLRNLNLGFRVVLRSSPVP